MQKKAEVSNFVGIMKSGIMKKRYLLASMALGAFFLSGARTFEAEGLWFAVTADNECVVTFNPEERYEGTVTVPPTVSFGGETYIVAGVDAYAFDGCDGLTAVVLPNTAVAVGRSAFYNCTALESFSGPGVSEIGASAFSGCTSLTSFGAGESLRFVGDSSFRNCSSLLAMALPEGTQIGESVFSGCGSLKSVALPAGITSLPAYTFSECVSLTSVRGLEEAVEIGDYAFSYCRKLPSVTLNAGLRAIGSHAFSMCSSFESETIQGEMLRIGSYAFEGCRSMSDVSLVGVVEIGEEAFSNCEGLTTVSMDEAMKNIRERAFRGSEQIGFVGCFAEQPPQMSTHSFPEKVYAGATLVVPDGKALLYMQTPPWSLFEHVYDSTVDVHPAEAAATALSSIGLTAVITGEPCRFAIYSLSGSKICEGEKAEGECRVEMPGPGMYVALLNGRSIKFVCR